MRRLVQSLAGPGLELPAQGDIADSADRLQALLGSERDVVHFTVLQTLDVELFAAVAGTLRGGGILHLDLPMAGDHTTERRAKDGLLQRLLAVLRERALSVDASGVMIVGTAADAEISSRPTLGAQAGRSDFSPGSSASQRQPSSGWRQDQDALLDRLIGRIRSGEPDCLVIQGRRGRGKSSLLGRLAARRAAMDDSSSISSPTLESTSRRSPAQLLLPHADVALIVRRHWDQELATLGCSPIELPVLSLQQAVRCTGQVLLIDEAAAVPLPTLVTLAARYTVMVLATTVEGYEPGGRAFAIRATRLLRGAGHRVEHVHSTQPVRWAADDPLEALLDATLLLDLQSPDADSSSSTSVSQALPLVGVDAQSADAEHPVVDRIDPESLQGDEPRLRSIVGLLIGAHYRTTLRDLRHVLQQTPLQLWSLTDRQHIIAVALVAREGRLPADVGELILARRRRLPDQLLPQLLAQTVNALQPLALRFARVVRIAVLPTRQRRGHGSRLLRGIEAAQASDLDALGASFGADEHTVRFWLANGYIPTHYGLRRNARSGRRAACMIRPLTPPAREPTATAHGLLQANLAAMRPLQPAQSPRARAPYATADTLPVETVIESSGTPSHWPVASTLDHRSVLQRFAANQRGAIDSAAALRWWNTRPGNNLIDFDDWFSSLREGLPGWRGREQALRTSVANWLADQSRID